MLQERVEEAFAKLVACQPEERRAQLAALRGVDTELFAEVESLVAVATKARGFLSIASVPPPVAFEPETLLGQRLGPYQIVGELGDGGMSTVFLGERADGQYRSAGGDPEFVSQNRGRRRIDRHRCPHPRLPSA